MSKVEKDVTVKEGQELELNGTEVEQVGVGASEFAIHLLDMVANVLDIEGGGSVYHQSNVLRDGTVKPLVILVAAGTEALTLLELVRGEQAHPGSDGGSGSEDSRLVN